MLRATRTPRTFGIGPRSRAIFCRPTPNLGVTTRNLFIACSNLLTARGNATEGGDHFPFRRERAPTSSRSMSRTTRIFALAR